MNRIYMDNAATTRPSAQVLSAMAACLGECFGNPSSQHFFGRQAQQLLSQARAQVARALGANQDEIHFTSGGTEADNWAIRGAAHALRGRGNHIITTQIEHHAVLHPCQALEREGFEVTYLAPDAQGFISPESLRRALTDRTVLVSVMAANNEVGSIQPIDQLSRIARQAGALFHTDAVQAAGCLPFDLNASQIDLLSLSAHKFHGPKGAGALYIRRGTVIEPLICGGAQEKSLRGGTENLAGLVGLGAAIEQAHQDRAARNDYVASLRDRLQQGLLAIPGAHLSGPQENRLPGLLNVHFDGMPNSTMLMKLDLRGVAVSAGSACTAGSADPSHVLLAMGLTREQAGCSIRFSLSDDNTQQEVDQVLRILAEMF